MTKPPSRKILFITKAEEAPSTRYRALMYFPLLRRAGWEPRHISIRHHKIEALRLASRADVVVVGRRTFDPLMRRLLRLACSYLIFDLDDAIYLSRPPGKSSRRMRRFASFVRLCDQVWAGNGILAEHARQYNGMVHVFPTSIDVSSYHAQDNKPDQTFDLVWIGSTSTRQYLQEMIPILEQVVSEIPTLRLKIISDFSLTSSKLSIVSVPWNASTEAYQIASAHVGIGPLPDDPWTRGKCGCKLLQYMASSLPVIASPTGVQKEIVVDGQTGLVVESASQWHDAILKLASDADLRHRMGQAGRQRAVQLFSLDATGKAMVDALNAIQ